MEPDFLNQILPGNQSIQPMGIEPLLPRKEIPTVRDVATNVAKNKLMQLAANKVGLNMAQASGLAGILGIGQSVFAPLGLVSALTGKSLGISDFLANKRAQKAAIKNANKDPQGNVVTYPVGIMAMQPTAQDIARGQGGGGGQGSYGMPGRAATGYQDL